MVRRIIAVLVVVLVALLGVRVVRASRAARRSPPVTPSVAPSVVAARAHAADHVRRIAATHGLRPALDTLWALVQRDSIVRGLGPSELHHLAHMLGQDAVAQRGGDPTVLAECRPGFEAGCFHGVMEGYFAARPHVDSATVATLCARIVPAGAPPQAVRECAHGMGHGLAVHFAHDIFRALPLCDALGGPAMRRECQDGVFMENVSFGLARAASPRTAGAGHAGHVHAAGAATDTAFLDPRRPRYPCDVVAPAYRPACWSYQPLVLLALDHSLDDALRGCDAAPAPATAECYWGLGKQAVGMLGGDGRRAAEVCRRGGPTRATACVAGIVAYYTDLTWTADSASAFCATLRAGERPRCAGAIGAAMGLMQRGPDAVARECAKAGPALAAACADGARGAIDAARRG